jgi:hypothetical protein
MYLPATLIVAFLSFFVEATPTSRSGFAIPITRRSQVRDANGVVDIARLQHSVSHSIKFDFLASSIQRITSHNWCVSRKIHHGFQTYEKNTGASHPSAPKVKLSETRKHRIGSDPLINMEWYGSISVGTPPKTFTGESSLLTSYHLERTPQCTVSFDTGSGDLFLPGSTCGGSCNGNTLYDASESSTAHNLGKPYIKGYADGSGTNGTLYTDDITIAGYKVGMCGSPTFPGR